MANNIQTIVSNKAESWSNAIHIKRYPSGTLKFLVVGGKFDNGTDQVSVTADQYGMYNFNVSATPPTKQYESKHVTVYYDYAGQWTILQSASRNLMLPVSKTVTPKALMSGFDALYKADKVDPEFGEAVIAWGATALDSASLDALVPKPLSSITLNESAFDYKQPIWFVADKAARKVHLFNNPTDTQSLVRYKTISQEFADAVAYYSPSTHRRTVAIFASNGTVSCYNVRMEKQPDVVLPYRVNRVVLLKATGAFDPLFAVFDSEGKVHKLDSNFSEVSSRTDDFYVNCHESLDAYITRDGRLVGTDVWQTPSASNFFYAFAPGTEDVYSVNFTDNTLARFGIKTSTRTDLGTADSNLLRYPATFTNPTASLILAAGADTTGRKSFVDRAQPLTDVSSRYWSYLSLMSNGATTQKYGFVARPTTTLNHSYLPTFGATLPAYDVPLGKKVTFTFVANFDDTDDVLPLILPEGIKWTATVNGKSVVQVRNGDSVTVTAEHEFLTNQAFPFSVGRSNGLVEVVPDPYPDPFTFETIYDVPDYSWQQTEVKTMTGINQRIELNITVDGKEDPDRVELYVNDVKIDAPYFMVNGDKFYMRIKHGYNITLINVKAGEYETDWGIYTVSEIEFDPIPNRAYAPTGILYQTRVLTNTGITALALTIDSDIGEFIQGGKAITLEIGQSTRVQFTPTEPDKKYQVKFGSSRYKYTWDIWTHETWLDDQPAPVYSRGMVVARSATIKFDKIPENFFTDVRVPAGVLFEIDGKDIDSDLDSRGVYRNAFELKDISCDSVLILESYPSHNTPKVLTFNKAEAAWLHDFEGELEYKDAGRSEVVEILAPDFEYAFDSRKTNNTTKFVSALMRQDTDDVVRVFGEALPRIHSETDMRYDSAIMRRSSESDMRYGSAIMRRNTNFDLFSFVSAYVSTDSNFDSKYQAAFSFASYNVKQVYEEWHLFAESIIKSPEMFSGYDSAYGLHKGFDFDNAFETSADKFEPKILKANDTVLIVKEISTSRRTNWNAINQVDVTLPDVQEWNKVSDTVETSPVYVETAATPSQYAAESDYLENTQDAKADPAPPSQQQDAEPYKQFMEADRIWPPVLGSHFGFEADITDTYNRSYVDPAVSIWRQEVIPRADYAMQWDFINLENFSISVAPSQPVIFTQANAEYSPPVPRWFEMNAQYQLTPHAEFVMAAVTYKYLNDPLHVGTTKVHRVDMSVELKVGSDAKRLESFVEHKIPSAIYKSGFSYAPALPPEVKSSPMSKARHVEAQTIQSGSIAPRGVEIISHPVDRMKVTMFVPTVDYGEPDPLKKGYFETELDALQNAVNVWKKSPDEIFAIQQPDKTWTWAIKIPCGEYCGEFGCDTRGYLAGG